MSRATSANAAMASRRAGIGDVNRTTCPLTNAGFMRSSSMATGFNFPDRGLYFPLSFGSLIGTCREALTILGLPSG
jgi:hypothetical protein